MQNGELKKERNTRNLKMSSTFVADTPEDTSADNTHVIIIVNDDTGNISEVDQEMLQQLLSMLSNFVHLILMDRNTLF